MKIFPYPPHRPAITRYLRIVLAACMLTIALPLVVPQATSQVHAQESYIIHVVAAGDNLTAIARRYNVPLSTLMAYNGISNANVIRLGQQIRIPTTTVQPAPTNTPVPTRRVGGGGLSGFTAAGEPVYTVRRGDTLSGIASQYGVTVRSIMQRNRLGSSAIIVSQRLIIPLNTTAPTPTKTYQAPTRASQAPTAIATTNSRAEPTSTAPAYSSFLITATPTPRLR